jgi:hypothetical protein
MIHDYFIKIYLEEFGAMVLMVKRKLGAKTKENKNKYDT